MEKILNQQEIDALVRAARGRSPSEAAAPNVMRCDFQQTNLIAGETMQAITQMHETFARSLTQRLSAFLQTDATVTLVSAESLPFLDYLDRVPNQSYLASLTVMPLAAQVAFQIDLGLAFSLLDSLLGGQGKGEPPERPASEIEQPILRNIIGIFCEEMEGPWQLLPLQFNFEQPQLSADFPRLIPFQERVLALSFEIKLAEASGAFSFAFPPVVWGALLRRISRHHEDRKPRRQAGTLARMRRLVRECQFPVDLSLCGIQITAQQMLDLQLGDVLTLHYATNRPATVVTGGIAAFQAQIARKGALRVAQLCAELLAPKSRVAEAGGAAEGAGL